jgi:hypothetical protein
MGFIRGTLAVTWFCQLHFESRKTLPFARAFSLWISANKLEFQVAILAIGKSPGFDGVHLVCGLTAHASPDSCSDAGLIMQLWLLCLHHLRIPEFA